MDDLGGWGNHGLGVGHVHLADKAHGQVDLSKHQGGWVEHLWMSMSWVDHYFGIGENQFLDMNRGIHAIMVTLL